MNTPFHRFIGLDDPAAADQPVGGKARALARLRSAGFPVPPGLVILPAAFAGEDSLAAATASALRQQLRDRFPGTDRFAVRSSAADEDGSDHSFAGQLESHLEVPLALVALRAADVVRSGRSERVRAYRAGHGLPAEPPVPAVLVQPMLTPIAAGVAFSSDPVSGRRTIAVVAAVRGLGEGLVSGARDADTWHIDRDGVIQAQARAADTPPGPPALSEDEVRSVAGLARRCATFFDRPQDIEWALDDTGLHLLQSRPITSLRGRHDPDGAFRLWDNSNIAESYSGTTTALTYSFARYIYEEVYQQFLALCGVPAARIADRRHIFGQLLGLVRGRVYYNLLSWNHALALLPGYALNRSFMEGMMGVAESLPPEGRAAVAALAPGRQTLRDHWATARGAAALLLQLARLPSTSRRFHARLDDALAMPPDHLAKLRLDELGEAYRTLERRLLRRWDAPLVNDFFAMVFFGLLGRLCARWAGDPQLHNALVAAQGGIVSAEPARRLREMAAIAAGDARLVECLRSGSRREIEAALQSSPALATALAAYLARFGERCLEELKLETATLHDDPLPLYRSIGEIAARPPGDRTPPPAPAAPRLPRLRFPRGLLFRAVLRQARNRVRDRENLRFERTRLFGRVRRLFVEIGRRLHAEGHLGDPREVFHLTVQEILGFIEGTAVTTDLAALATLRRSELERHRSGAAPADRFHTWGAVHDGNTFQRPPRTTPDPAAHGPVGDERQGLGCCPGRVRGPARVILDPRSATIGNGEILVAPRTDPGWVLLFPTAAGLVVEHGSLLSHSAIVARELGLPCVVSVRGLTGWLSTGDLVEIDGSTGSVRRIPRDETAPSS